MDKKSVDPVRILITAGPTIEPIDPVRYMSNYSTGTMGYEIASECVKRGFDVCLISGPVCLSPPLGVELIEVETSEEMKNEVIGRAGESDCLIMAAAVCDFRPVKVETSKIKKNGGLTLTLVKTADILAETGRREGFIKVGFALETEDPIGNGRKKLANKELDMIVVNVKSEKEDPFGPGKKKFSIIKNEDEVREEEVTKKQMAAIIMDEVGSLARW